MVKHARIVTSEEVRAEVALIEEKKREKALKVMMPFGNKRKVNGKTVLKQMTRKARLGIEDSDDDNDSGEEEDENDINDNEEESDVISDVNSDCDNDVSSEEDTEKAITKIQNAWKSLDVPDENDIKGKWYAFIYQKEDRKKSKILYIGKLLRRFLVDKDGPIASIEVKCLKPKFGSGIVLEETPNHLPPDIFV